MEDMEANSIYLIPETICFIHVSWSIWPGTVLQKYIQDTEDREGLQKVDQVLSGLL